MKKFCLLCLAVLAWGVPPAPAASSPERLPEEVMGLLEVNDLRASGPRLQELAVRVHPHLLVPSPQAIVRSRWLKTQNARSVDTSEPLRLLMLAPPLHREPVLLFTAEDTSLYLDSLLPTIRRIEESDGLHVFREANSRFPEQRKEGRPLYIATAGSRVALGREKQAVRQVLRLLGEDRLPAEGLFEAEAGALLRVGRLLEDLRERNEGPLEEMKKRLQYLGPPGSAHRNRAEMQVAMLEEALAQIDLLTATASLQEHAVNVVFRARMAPGGGLAAYARSVPPGSPDLRHLLPADAMFAGVWKMGDLTPLVDWYFDTLGSLPRLSEAQKHQITGASGASAQLAAVLGDEASFAVSPTPGGELTARWAVEVRDVEQADAALAAAAARLPDILKIRHHRGLGLEMTSEEAPSSDSAPHILHWTFRLEASGRPTQRSLREAAAMGRAAFHAAWGEELHVFATRKAGHLFFTAGHGARDELREMVAAPAGGETADQVLAAAAEGLPDGAVGLSYLRVGQMADWHWRMLNKVLEAGPVSIPLPRLEFGNGPPAAAGTWVEEEMVLTRRLRLPLGALRAVAVGFLGAAPAGRGPQEVPAETPHHSSLNP